MLFSTCILLLMLQRAGAIVRDTFFANLFGGIHAAAMAAMRDAVTVLVLTAISIVAVIQWWKRYRLVGPLQKLHDLWLR